MPRPDDETPVLSSGSIFNSDFDAVVRRYVRMRDENPKAYIDAVTGFQAMACGMPGPSEYIDGRGLVSVRALYFQGWEDDNFFELLVRLRRKTVFKTVT